MTHQTATHRPLGDGPGVTRLAAYGVIRKDDRVLLCRISPGYPAVGMWTLPGGGIEFGEAPEAAAVREVEEETGLIASITGTPAILSDTGTWPRPGTDVPFHQVRFVYPMEIVGGAERVEVGGSTDAFGWFSHEEVAALPIVELVGLALSLPPRRDAGMDPEHAPILEFDPAPAAVLEPHLSIKRFDLPARVVLCFFRDAIAAFVEELGGREIGRLGSEIGSFPVFEVVRDGQRVAISQAGVGAPLAAGWLDELITLGGRAFVAVGGAGVLVPDIAMGHVVVPTAAVRDEGTSYHYLPAAREVEPTADALNAIVATLEARMVPHVAGKTWTTDGIYRETRDKVARRVAEGCLTVEMEAAAFFAVARFRGVSFGQMLYAGDDLSGEAWDHRGWLDHGTGRDLLLRLGVEAVLRIEVGEPQSERSAEASSA